MSDLFRDCSLAFFIVSWKGNFVTSETASSNRRTEQRFVNIPSAVIYLIRTWAETKILIDPHRDNELLYPSFDGFHAQLDCKITNVLEKWGETLDFVLCVSLRSSVSLMYLPIILSCSSRSLRALQRNSMVVLRDQSFFLISWVEWVELEVACPSPLVGGKGQAYKLHGRISTTGKYLQCSDMYTLQWAN